MAKQRSPIGNEDFNFVRCTHCGFPCNLGRDKIRDGNGQNYFELTHTQDQAPDDSTVSFGCPQCGKGDYRTTNKVG
jgi:predicted RNA-binding Zn-ribbon protein involved in translation (DUF1610 family)